MKMLISHHRFPRGHRAGFFVMLLFMVALLVSGLKVELTKPQESADREVLLLTIEGVINPLTAQYLLRGIQEAEDTEAGVVIVRLNTSGGLESSMREMTQAMLNSPVPVVVYVTPPGGRAASAGMFITIAANVAAMAPGTNIGAAHPVGIGEQTDPVMAEKLTNDAAALARAIATVRGRNAAWAEQAVRDSVSITAGEALEMNVIDLVASDLEALLQMLDGRQVMTTAGEITLQTAGVQVVDRPLSLPERILQTITDPNIAYVLFTIGVIGIIAELYNPGMLFPGITGAISLILAFVAFGSLPISWAGILLLLLAIGFFIAELNTEGTGILAVGGVIAFVIGSLMLYTPLTPTSPAMPQVGVSPWLIATMTAIISGVFIFVIRAIWKARQEPVAVGVEALAGRTGTVVTDLAPEGTVRVGGELWTAKAVDGPIRVGEEIEIVAVEGVILKVRRL